MVTALAMAIALASSPGEGEARVSLDVREAPVVDVAALLAEVAGAQVIFDPGISCKLTLKVTEMRWLTVLDLALRSCGLAYEEENTVLRIAPVARLREEAAARRRLDEEKRLAGPLHVTRIRLSYARAQEMAPIVKRFLSPRGDVVYDVRTNTLIIIDVSPSSMSH
jgi:type IV pilus assembly protein PilQ